MPFDFDKAAGKAKARKIAAAKGGADRKAPETDYQARGAAEAKRRALATDGEFWACVCFKTADDMAAFQERTGFDRVTFCDQARELLADIMPEVNRRSRPARVMGGEHLPYVFAGVEYTHGLEEDCKREAAALVSALRDRRPRQAYRSATDSPYYIVLVCESRADREALYDRFGLWRFGAGYLDGSAWLARLRASR